MRRLENAALILAVSLMAPSRAHAGDNAEQLIKQGVELRAQKKDAEALDHFQRAYAVAPTPRALAQIALAEQALGSWASAEEHLADALSHESDAWIRTRRAPLKEAMQEIREHVGSLEISGPVGAEVTIAGRQPFKLPLEKPLRLVVGDVSVSVASPGFRTLERKFTIVAHAALNERFDLVPEPPPPPAAVRRPIPAVVETSPAASDGSLPTAAVITAGAAALGLGIGVVGLIVRAGHVARYNDDRQCLPPNGLTREQNCGSERSAAVSAQTIAIAGFVAAGALGVATAVIYAFGSEAGDNTVASSTGVASCGPGPGTAGVGCVLHF
jgi:hypothetical protein